MLGLGYFFFFNYFTAALAQKSFPVLKGKVNGGFNVNGIYVINLTTEKRITDGEGYFGIKEAGDTLLLSAVQYKSRRVVLTSEDFENRLL
jgi:hypothetical protein